MLRPYHRRYLEPNNMREKRYGDFEYVVFKRPPPKIAFGSGLTRQGLRKTAFMMHHSQEENLEIGPETYHTPVKLAFYDTMHKPSSTAGVGDKSPRFREPRGYQPPPQLPPKPGPFKQNCAPFNSTTKRSASLGNHNPAPCDYLALYKPKKMKFAHSFGGKKTLMCSVEIKCVPWNLDACEVCGKSCSAQGDYWQYENRVFLCRKHYTRLYRKALAKINGLKLSEFKPIRDCFFAHLHNSCNASIKLMTKEQIERKLRKEAYLDLYFPQRKIFT